MEITGIKFRISIYIDITTNYIYILFYDLRSSSQYGSPTQ